MGVHLPAGQGCCGIPALSGGDTQTFRQLVRLNLELLDDPAAPCDYLVTACATCSSTIKQLWPLMMGDAEPAVQERVAALAAKTLDISQFLVDQVGVAPAAIGPEAGRIPLTYHDPCHLKKSLGVAAQPRVLLAANPAYILTGDARVRLVLRLRRQLHSPALRGLGGHRQTQAGQHRRLAVPGGGHRLPRLHAPNHRHALPGRAAGPGEAHGGDLRRVFEERKPMSSSKTWSRLKIL